MKICVVGGGPAAAYFIREIISRSKAVTVDVFEKGRQLLGHLRDGVAPDQEGVRKTIPALEKVFDLPQVNTARQMEVGKDVDLRKIQAEYSAIVIAAGAEERRIEIPGKEHVLSADKIARDIANGKSIQAKGKIGIIGNGNVSLDIARMLLQSERMDKYTAALRGVEVEEVEIIGRKSPKDAKFTNPVLAELIDHRTKVKISERAKNYLKTEPAETRAEKRRKELLEKETLHRKTVKFTFWEHPVSVSKVVRESSKENRQSSEIENTLNKTDSTVDSKLINRADSKLESIISGVIDSRQSSVLFSPSSSSSNQPTATDLTVDGIQYELTTVDDKGRIRKKMYDSIISAVGYKPKDWSAVLDGVTVPVYLIGWAATEGRGTLAEAYSTAVEAAEKITSSENNEQISELDSENNKELSKLSGLE